MGDPNDQSDPSPPALRETVELNPNAQPGEKPIPDRQGKPEPGEKPSPNLPPSIGPYRVERLLGEGTYGQVYLAHDDELKRRVAIKVPHRHRITCPEDLKAYLAEARIAASLDHPNIVPVYHVGQTDDGLCYVVSKFIEGNDLRATIEQSRPSPVASAELVATVAEALNYAHLRGLVHRDIKPANILLDCGGKPYIADFGLALKEEDFGKQACRAGTPAYMSPEQARGEGHRVDGRTDIFGLGVVLYELLTGHRPFPGKTPAELLEHIATIEPRPLRQRDESIPRELERICLKALSKRVTDRYLTAADMADDIRQFLKEVGESGRTKEGERSPPSTPPAPSVSPTGVSISPERSGGPSGSSSDKVIKIVPKGLRSFDAHDADFFLELLPGPRDRNGLPDSIRFWKTRIEETDPDQTFSVGLVYGPSGCGKSSLVKAGLLPRLAAHVIPIYIEATANGTESRLLKGLRRQCPLLPESLSLGDSLAAIRRGRLLPSGKKILIVLDQFEQWLHGKALHKNTNLVEALRQCDGDCVQCIVMVRDDFWLAISRFMQQLEIRLVEGHNSALVDLFDLRHTKNVLAAFGRAFRTLPERPGEIGNEQRIFLDQAVQGLAQDGKVICVRLALFAEMMKGKPWTPATLKRLGGTEGVGVVFLEETFCVPTAPPEHRYHEKAARSVLKALLPESGTDIRGHMRSQDELLAASGYANHPSGFDGLIRILDGELRLITPTDPEGRVEEDSQTSIPSGQRFYQLTHDYLVPALRDWLTRKQRETRRGRAELLLADRASVWNARPETRQLPSLFQWCSIRFWTGKKTWSESQRKMMKKAGRHHLFRACVVAIVLGLIGWGSYEGYGRLQAKSLVGRLSAASISEVLQTVQAIEPYRPWANSLLEEAKADAEKIGDSGKLLRFSLALLPVDPEQVDYLYERLLNSEPQEVPVIRDALTSHKEALIDKLWRVAEEPAKGKEGQRLRAACALATYDPDSQRWAKVKKPVTDDLVRVPSVYLGNWLESLRPVRARLVETLAGIFRDKNRRETERSLATDILADYAADQATTLADLLMDADEKQYPVLYPKLTDHGDEGAKPLLAELDRRLEPTWTDPPLNSAWVKPDAAVIQKIESAQGILAERFGFCQSMPLEEFVGLADQLRKSGYRPTRVRPYTVAPPNEGAGPGATVLVAAVWTRDGRDWQLAHGLPPDGIQKRDDELSKKGYAAVDVAGYLQAHESPGERYLAIWVKRNGDQEDARLYVGASAANHQSVVDAIEKAGFPIQRTLQLFRGLDGQQRFCGVKSRTGEKTAWASNETQSQIEANVLNTDLQDIDIGSVQRLTPKKSRQQQLTAAEAVLKLKPGDLNAGAIAPSWVIWYDWAIAIPAAC